MLIPTVIKKTANGQAAFDLYSRLLEDNIIFIDGEINQELASIVVGSLKYLEAKDPKQTISIWINSQGGEIYSGYSIIDTIHSIKNPVQTVATGYVASMGTTIFINGDKGNRLIQPHCRVLVHQPLGGVKGQASEIEIEYKEIQLLKEQLEDEYVALTKVNKKKMHEMMDRDTWLSAEEAVKLGLADKIIQ